MESTQEQEQVQVRFFTRQPKYAVSDAPILVPATFKRQGLSEIINNLLELEKPIPFEFLIDGEILRTSIAQYLQQHQLSTENVLTIEYVESMLPPSPLSAFQHDDWISSVRGSKEYLLTGSYDNAVRLWNLSGECVATFIGHRDAVKSVAFGATGDDEETVIFSGGLDHSIMAWAYSAEKGQRELYECKGHKGSVESIAVNSKQSHFASASSDGLVKVWSTAVPEESDSVSEATGSKKRRKTDKGERKIKTQASNLEGHVGAVNAVVFDNSDDNRVYTGGWDHSIRSWDVEQQVNLVTKNCEKVVLDVDYSSRSRLLATGHGDNVLRLWDPRSEDGVNVKLALRGHTEWVSSVSWSPSSEYTLCSGSYDSTVRIWDIRSKAPLYTVKAEADDEKDKKIFSVHWNENRILSGGESKKLRIYSASS